MERLLPKNKVYLDEELKEEFPSVSVAEDESLINFRLLKNLRPLCYHCGTYSLSYGQKYFWHRCASFKHFYCYYCFDYSLKKYTHSCIDGEPILDECKTLEHLLCEKLKFECKWPQCKKIFGGGNLRKHEISCQLQPTRECPVEKCSWSGSIDQLANGHFKEHEDSKVILRNVVIKLESGKKYYLLILDKFVLVDYVAEELGEVYEHNVSLNICKESVSYAKPVGLVSFNHTLLKKMEGSDSVKSVRKNVVLFVYFEDK